jgi:DNA-binding MarR family transcriptional regulator
MKENLITELRRQSQSYAYTSIKMHEAVARKAGFSGTDHKYLGFFLQKGQMTAGELASLTGLTTGAVTGLIDRFEKKSLVIRRYSEGDRRKVIVIPKTERIMALLAPLYEEFRFKMEKLAASLSEDELKTIAAYFEKSIKIMTETIDDLKE